MTINLDRFQVTNTPQQTLPHFGNFLSQNKSNKSDVVVRVLKPASNEHGGQSFTFILESLGDLAKVVDEGCIHFFNKESNKSGGLVTLFNDTHYGRIPALKGSDGVPVYVYQLVDKIVSIVDLNEVANAFPTLSQTQVASAASWLRGVAQFNTKGINIDEEQFGLDSTTVVQDRAITGAQEASLHTISHFRWEDITYELRSPVEYTVTYEGLWVYRCIHYGLHAFAADKAQAFEEFNEEFIALYDGLVNEPDENLTQDAIQMKQRLIEDVVLPN